MGRFARKQVAIDRRTGFKVRASRLIEDGEVRGLYVVDPDMEHPQKFLRPTPLDPVPLRRVFPQRGQPGVDILIGFEGDPSRLDLPRLSTPAIPLSIGGFAVQYKVAVVQTAGPITFDSMITTFDETGKTWDRTL